MNRCLVGSQAEDVLCNVRWKNQLPCWCIRFTRWSRLISRFYIQNILNIWLFIAAVLTSIIIRQSRCPLSSLLCPSPQSVIISIIFSTICHHLQHLLHNPSSSPSSSPQGPRVVDIIIIITTRIFIQQKLFIFLKSRIFNEKISFFFKRGHIVQGYTTLVPIHYQQNHHYTLYRVIFWTVIIISTIIIRR